jgi:hypothetical protein
MNETFYLYLTGTTAYLRRTTGYFGRGPIDEVGQWEWDCLHPLSLNFDAVEGMGKERRRRLRVYLGSALCKFLVDELPDGVRDDEYLDVASAQTAHKLGLTASEWEFTFQLRKSDRKIFTCALRKQVAERIRTLAAKHRLKLMSMTPFVAALWNESTKFSDDAASSNLSLIVVEEDSFTTLASSDGVIHSMNSFFHRSEADLVNREVNRLQFSFGVEQNIGVALLEKLRPIVDHQPEKLIRVRQAQSQQRRHDFSDLMFCDEAGEAV